MLRRAIQLGASIAVALTFGSSVAMAAPSTTAHATVVTSSSQTTSETSTRHSRKSLEAQDDTSGVSAESGQRTNISDSNDQSDSQISRDEAMAKESDSAETVVTPSSPVVEPFNSHVTNQPAGGGAPVTNPVVPVATASPAYQSPAITQAVAAASTRPHVPLTVVNTRILDDAFSLNQPSPTPVAQVATTAPTDPPHTPAIPFSSMMMQLKALLTNMFVPAAATIANFSNSTSLADSSTNTFPILLLVVIMTFILHIPMASYAERLRRNGFLGAPRSHVAYQPSFFAAPPKWVLSAVVQRS